MLSDEIINQRRGNITASAAHHIMAGWDAPQPMQEAEPEILQWIRHTGRKPKVGDIKAVMYCDVNMKTIDAAWAVYQYEKPPQGLITYAEQLACDELFEPDPMLWDGSGNPHIENGREREVDAMLALSEATSIDFVKTGDDQVHISINGVGCTPDGIAYDELDLIEAGAEVKCRSPLHHARQLMIHDNATLMKHDFDRYCQIQVCYAVTGAERWYSASYNPHALNPSDAFNYCLIERDDKFLAAFWKRAALVFEHKQRFFEQIESTRNIRETKRAV